jgi:hypothetical protein
MRPGEGGGGGGGREREVHTRARRTPSLPPPRAVPLRARSFPQEAERLWMFVRTTCCLYDRGTGRESVAGGMGSEKERTTPPASRGPGAEPHSPGRRSLSPPRSVYASRVKHSQRERSVIPRVTAMRAIAAMIRMMGWPIMFGEECSVDSACVQAVRVTVHACCMDE